MSAVKVALCLLACVVAVFSRPDTNIESRIVGGQTATTGQFPFQVSIRSLNIHFCGGSIISPNKILTAAHCIYGRILSLIDTVVVGSNLLSSSGYAYSVANAVYHPSFDPQTLFNDIAVLTLRENIGAYPNVANITLATSNPSPGASLILSGWGLTSYPGFVSNTLQYVNLQNLDLQTCAQMLQGASPITSGDVCTTSPQGQGACQGDSGGPLIDTSGNQVGIVSWGIPCAKGYPDVFTSVAFYRSWILQQ